MRLGMTRLREECERAKKALGDPELKEVKITVKKIKRKIDLEIPFTREKYKEIV